MLAVFLSPGVPPSSTLPSSSTSSPPCSWIKGMKLGTCTFYVVPTRPQLLHTCNRLHFPLFSDCLLFKFLHITVSLWPGPLTLFSFNTHIDISLSLSLSLSLFFTPLAAWVWFRPPVSVWGPSWQQRQRPLSFQNWRNRAVAATVSLSWPASGTSTSNHSNQTRRKRYQKKILKT